MFTQCPHCQTLFRVRAEHLRLALGMVRCNQCQQIFNAVDHLYEELSAIPAGNGIPAQTADEPPDPQSAVHELPPPVAEIPESAMDDDASEALVTDLEPESAIPDEQSPISTKPRTGIQAPASFDQSIDVDPREYLSIETAKELPDIVPTEDTAEDDGLVEREKSGRHSVWIWSLAVVVLLATLSIQSAWWYRDRMIYQDQARIGLEILCRITGCVVPARRAIDKLEILHRDFSSHPFKKDALVLRLTLINRADFPQPYPTLQLGLLDDNQKLVAQRRFKPSEYLASDHPIPDLMARDNAVELSLELIDPGVQATGFRFDFF